jgi:hypothetical protein
MSDRFRMRVGLLWGPYRGDSRSGRVSRQGCHVHRRDDDGEAHNAPTKQEEDPHVVFSPVPLGPLAISGRRSLPRSPTYTVPTHVLDEVRSDVRQGRSPRLLMRSPQ